MELEMNDIMIYILKSCLRRICPKIQIYFRNDFRIDISCAYPTVMMMAGCSVRERWMTRRRKDQRELVQLHHLLVICNIQSLHPEMHPGLAPKYVQRSTTLHYSCIKINASNVLSGSMHCNPRNKLFDSFYNGWEYLLLTLYDFLNCTSSHFIGDPFS